jgi:hypothetical protein
VEALYFLFLLGVTSAAAFALGRRRWGLGGETLRGAIGRLLECAGLAVLFFLANLAAGFATVLVLRRLTGAFLSLYVNTDPALFTLSIAQAVLFQWWRAGERRPGE